MESFQTPLAVELLIFNLIQIREKPSKIRDGMSCSSRVWPTRKTPWSYVSTTHRLNQLTCSFTPWLGQLQQIEMLRQASHRVLQTAGSKKTHPWWGILLHNILWWSSRVLTARILPVRHAYARREKAEVSITTKRSTFPRAKAESCKTHPNSKIGSTRLTWIRTILHRNILNPLKTCQG